MKQRIVLALGGNALQQNGEATAEAQKSVAVSVGETVAALASDYEIIIAHGNGPQVGNILIHEESAATPEAPAMPLETAVAMSQGQIGYWLSQAINNAFMKSGQTTKVASIVTEVVVSSDDPAFQNPTKPIGQFYTADEAATLASEKGWSMREDAGRGWRRVVPSPLPLDIVESAAILDLIKAGVVVIATGGGGIPVVKQADGTLSGIDAVIDKDFAAEKLAELTDADVFVSVTAVPNAFLGFGTPEQTALSHLTPTEADQYKAEFKAGSMLPKIEAASAFAKLGKTGIITDLSHLAEALQGQAGTIIAQ